MLLRTTLRRLFLIGLLFLSLPILPVHASSIRYVAPTVQGSGDCSSWSNACTLQTALTTAVSGVQIWVKMGVHKPTTNPAQRTAAFALKSDVAIYGGFAGTETALNQRDWTLNITVLSGDIDNNDTVDASGVVTTATNIVGSNAYHVVSATNVLSTAVVDGFVITGGQANNGAFPHNAGGGMYIQFSNPTLTNITFSGNTAAFGGGAYSGNGNPLLTNVAFTGNSATSGGGGIYLIQSDPLLTRVSFRGNTAQFGGGIAGFSSDPTLRRVTFIDNAAQESGGGMYSSDGVPLLLDVTFRGNTAKDGGGMSNWSASSPILINVIFHGNAASLWGGGMVNRTNSNPTLTNVIFHGNTAQSGGGIFTMERSNPTLINVTVSGNTAQVGGGAYNVNNVSNPPATPNLRNVIIWGNEAPLGANIHNSGAITPTITFSDVQGCGGSGGGWQSSCGNDGGGNIDADPQFVNAASGDLRLLFVSPAINAGNNTFIPPGVTTDLNGAARISGSVVDMGAYEAIIVTVSLPLIMR
ncbi:choice-of-anchor Q domain-containing protein [Roseiflexus sp.]